ncbi:MAG: YggS family pyridoxal phosphate-dependent enzyme [Clostridia bacterium]|nr:YggS family pyridoxal phosphate-dependent enzyme [Clostridia bacterium]
MLKENLDKIFSVIENGNNLGEPITLVGATKMVSAEIINQAISYGLKVVAENKVQEFNLKHGQITGAKEHFIGHLQTNKVKYLVGKVELIHSVDSIRLAEEINRQAVKKGVTQDILIEVNIGGELSKSGFDFSNAKKAVNEIANSFSNVRVKGLMAMLPHSEDESLLIDLTEKMRALYDDLIKLGLPFTYLSVGMSNDYKIAIKHGSNMIRLGRDIFGQRNYGEVK